MSDVAADIREAQIRGCVEQLTASRRW